MTPALQALFAGLPILAILVLMIGFRLPAAKAGGFGLLVTIIVAWWVFGFGTRVLPELGMIGATVGSLAEAVFIAFSILWIIFPALCIYELQQSTGAIEKLRTSIAALSPDPRITALLIAWFFALFMEGAAGFGTSAALAAPFLVAMGFGRLDAVCIALIGHAIGVSFGAVGTPIQAQIAMTPYTGLQLSAATGVYHSLLGWLMALAVMFLVNRAMSQKMTNRTVWAWTLAAAALFLLPYYLIATFVGPELPTLGGSLLGGILFVGTLLLFRQRRTSFELAPNLETPARQNLLSLLRAASPYLMLIVLILSTRLIPPVRETLRGVTLHWRFEIFQTDLALLYHPGTMLFLSFMAGALCQQALLKNVVGAMQKALQRLLPVTLALVAMLGLSRIMVHAGLIDTLASVVAESTGQLWPLLAPFVGVLGTFVTGSATASNILFTEFQQATAERLGFRVSALVGAQGFGAAVGNIICPHNIIAASAIVGLSGKEGEVLRRTLGVTLIYTFLGGLLALFVFA